MYIQVYPHSRHSNIATWRVHNALLIIRLTLKYVLEKRSEAEAILQLDGSARVNQITSLEEKTKAMSIGLKVTETGHAPTSHGQEPKASTLSQVPVSTLDSFAEKTAGGSSSEGSSGVEREGQSVKIGEGARGGSINPEEVAAMETLLSRQLVEGLVCLLAEVPLM